MALHENRISILCLANWLNANPLKYVGIQTPAGDRQNDHSWAGEVWEDNKHWFIEYSWRIDEIVRNPGFSANTFIKGLHLNRFSVSFKWMRSIIVWWPLLLVTLRHPEWWAWSCKLLRFINQWPDLLWWQVCGLGHCPSTAPQNVMLHNVHRSSSSFPPSLSLSLSGANRNTPSYDNLLLRVSLVASEYI